MESESGRAFDPFHTRIPHAAMAVLLVGAETDVGVRVFRARLGSREVRTLSYLSDTRCAKNGL